MKSARPESAGAHTSSRAQRAGTQRDLPPLPSGSIHDFSLTDADRSRAAGRFVVAFFSFVFLIPMICVGVILRFQ